MTKLTPAALSGKQSRHLKALAHHLDPVVQVGKEGASESVIAAVSAALTDHELIKVRLPQVEKDERHDIAVAVAEGAPAHLVGELGRIAVLYRRHPSEPKITLPR
jgi:RNA-binding protein